MLAKELDAEITTISGAKIMLTPNKALTYRSALITACETFTGEPGSGDTLKAFNLGMKIMDAKDELTFAKEDVDFLKQVVESNRGFVAVVVGRLLEFINKK